MCVGNNSELMHLNLCGCENNAPSPSPVCWQLRGTDTYCNYVLGNFVRENTLGILKKSET